MATSPAQFAAINDEDMDEDVMAVMQLMQLFSHACRDPAGKCQELAAQVMEVLERKVRLTMAAEEEVALLQRELTASTAELEVLQLQSRGYAADGVFFFFVV